MPQNKDPLFGSLLKTADHRHGGLHEFANVHPDVWDLIEEYILSARLVHQSVQRCVTESQREAWTLILIRSTYDYLEDSLYLLLASRVDAGYALLRLAAESARTAARISESDENFNTWLDYRISTGKKTKKPGFEFNESDPIERGVYLTYKKCSDFGVHSHITSVAFESECKLTPNGDYVMTRASDLDVLETLLVWLHAFIPALFLASKGFHTKLTEIGLPAHHTLLQLIISKQSALEELTGRIKKQRSLNNSKQ